MNTYLGLQISSLEESNAGNPSFLIVATSPTVKSTLPHCATCAATLKPVFQIAIDSLHSFFKANQSPAFIQMFYCINKKCEESGSMDDVTADNYTVRLTSQEDHILDSKAFSARTIHLAAPLEDDLSEPSTDDKIGGYPAWVHDEAYPTCKFCKNNQKMEFRLQLSIPEIPDIPFPEHTVIFVSQCSEHSSEFGMVWQCS